MEPSDSRYVHGTHPYEQERLSRLNALLNGRSLRAMALRGGERVLDVGSGLGQLTRMLARRVGSTGLVIGVEMDEEQLAEAIRQARDDGEKRLVEFRRGDAVDLPLADDEWGTFDVAHARFILEHVTDPLAVVRSMVRAVRPGGRIVLEDDDHDVLRLEPEPPGVLELWRAYYKVYTHQGKDPFVGRRLISLLHQAGATPRSNNCRFFGGSAGSSNFGAMVDNFVGIIDGAREAIVTAGLADADQIDRGLEAFRAWGGQVDAALWYTTSWAEGVRPGAGRSVGVPAIPPKEQAPDDRATPLPGVARAEPHGLLGFLMDAAAELNSSLQLDQVFHKIATGLQPHIDYHLFCVQLWNEETQLLEHSFSMKYGQAIPQKGGFPLGYGIGGTCAATRQTIRVPNVLEDSRYVRFRHPEVEVHSELAVPLLFHEQLIGVLDLESTEFDYFTEAHEQMVSALASHIATALVNARLYERVLRDERRLERDLATARQTQRQLLPEAVPCISGLDIGSIYSPARELGGDFYDFLRYGEGRWGFALGDVAGKATPAALLGSMTVGLLRAHVVERPVGPAEMLTELNEHLQSGEDNRFVAMILAVYEEQTRQITLANAGCPRALHVRDDGLHEIPVEGMPLGMFPGTRYREEILHVRAGELILFCSDGLFETENPRGEAFGVERVGQVIDRLASRPAQEIADDLCRAAIEFAGTLSGQSDDHTVVVLKCL